MTARIRVSKEMTFEAAHRLRFHRGACRNVHGHSYRCRVTVEGEVLTEPVDLHHSDMVLDFGELSAAMRSVLITGEPCNGYPQTIPFDHAIILHESDPLFTLLTGQMVFEDDPEFDFDLRIVRLTREPTAEYMAQLIAGVVDQRLPHGEVVRVELWETVTSCATWEAGTVDSDG